MRVELALGGCNNYTLTLPEPDPVKAEAFVKRVLKHSEYVSKFRENGDSARDVFARRALRRFSKKCYAFIQYVPTGAFVEPEDGGYKCEAERVPVVSYAWVSTFRWANSFDGAGKLSALVGYATPVNPQVAWLSLTPEELGTLQFVEIPHAVCNYIHSLFAVPGAQNGSGTAHYVT